MHSSAINAARGAARLLVVAEDSLNAEVRARLAGLYEVHAARPESEWRDLAARLEVDLVLRVGEERWMATHSYLDVHRRWAELALPDAKGDVPALVREELRVHQIRRELDERLAEAERRFRGVADESPWIFFVTDENGSCSYLNERWFEFTGQQPGTSVGDGWWGALHGEDVESARESWQDALKRQDSARIEYRLVRHDGSFRWVRHQCVPRLLHGRFAGYICSIIDITDERHELDELEHERSRIHLALRAGRSGTFDWDVPSGRVVLSSELATLYGVSRESLARTYRGWLQMLEPADAVRVEREIQHCFERQLTETSFEFRVRPAEGRDRWIEAKACFSYGAGGVPRRMLGIHTDIDTRKRAELHAAFLGEISSNAFMNLGPSELLSAVTRELGVHLGLARCFVVTRENEGDVCIQNAWNRDGTVPPLVSVSGRFSDDATDERLWVRLFEVGTVVASTGASLAGRDAWHPNLNVRAWAAVPHHQDGLWVSTLVVADDRPRVWQADELDLIETLFARVWSVVERARIREEIQQAEAKIHDGEERQRLAIEAAQLGTCDYDLRAKDYAADERWRRLHGIGLAEPLEPEPFLRGVRPECRGELAEQIAKARSGRNDGLVEAEYSTDAVSPRGTWVRMRGRFIFERRRPARFIGTAFDITDVVKARESLAERRRELEQTVAERTAELQRSLAELESFSYSISHDLRAPLRAIHSFAEVIAKDFEVELGEEGADYLRRITRAVQRMDHLIHDVLMYSRVSRTELTLQTVNLSELVDGIVESYPLFQSAQADVVIERPLPRVLGNEAALTQCLSNLLGNAVKFVSPGTKPAVRIWAERADDRVLLYVRDNGVGIPSTAHKRIFEIFQRANAGYEGTGIGLAIVKRAAERMGANVTVVSAEGRGSTFCLELRSAE